MCHPVVKGWKKSCKVWFDCEFCELFSVKAGFEIAGASFNDDLTIMDSNISPENTCLPCLESSLSNFNSKF